MRWDTWVLVPWQISFFLTSSAHFMNRLKNSHCAKWWAQVNLQHPSPRLICSTPLLKDEAFWKRFFFLEAELGLRVECSGLTSVVMFRVQKVGNSPCWEADWLGLQPTWCTCHPTEARLGLETLPTARGWQQTLERATLVKLGMRCASVSGATGAVSFLLKML